MMTVNPPTRVVTEAYPTNKNTSNPTGRMIYKLGNQNAVADATRR